MLSPVAHRGWIGSLARLLILPLALGAACSSGPSGPPHGLYIAHEGSHMLVMEIRDSNRGVLMPDISLTYAIVGDTLIAQADPRRGEPPSPPSRFLIIRDTLRELKSTTPLVFVRQRN